MPFVAPMTIALCLGALALLDARRDRPCRAASGAGCRGRTRRAFYGFVALFVATTATQLLIDSVQLRLARRRHA